MKKKFSPKELKIVASLRAACVPLDDEIVRELSIPSLTVVPSESVLSNEVFDLDNGRTGFMIELCVSNDADRVIFVDHFRLEIPWLEPTFRWLELRRFGPDAKAYSFPNGGPQGLDPTVVLNGRVGRRGKFFPGDPLEGLLLGIGDSPIPETYVDRQGVGMTLSIYQTNGLVVPVDITLCVRRSKPSWRPALNRPLRERLFTRDEIAAK